jgi:hypothetical protein
VSDHGHALSAAVLIGLVAFTADQISDFVRIRAALAAITAERAAQAKPLEAAQRIEHQLDALASGTARLAQDGNPAAARIVSGMQANGVMLRPPVGAGGN